VNKWGETVPNGRGAARKPTRSRVCRCRLCWQ